jgi:hypothetical protein
VNIINSRIAGFMSFMVLFSLFGNSLQPLQALWVLLSYEGEVFSSP